MWSFSHTAIMLRPKQLTNVVSRLSISFSRGKRAFAPSEDTFEEVCVVLDTRRFTPRPGVPSNSSIRHGAHVSGRGEKPFPRASWFACRTAPTAVTREPVSRRAEVWERFLCRGQGPQFGQQ